MSKVNDDVAVCPECGYDFQQDFPTNVSFNNIYMSEIELIKNKLQSKYEVKGFIGKGGFSTVLKLRDIELDRLCALKILSKDLISDPEMLERFKREARLYAKLDHPNIVQVYDVGFYNKVAYIIMKYIDGVDLKTYIKENSPLALDEIIGISKDIASVLQYMHERGIIHRDIKPANIMIQKRDGKAILTDFGLAKSLETTKFTATGKIMGSPHYLAPEQAKGEPVSKSTDIYSLGITMFEMATGKVPFEGETAVQIVLKHIREEVPKPSKVKPDVLSGLEKIIIKATKRNPSSRYQNAKDLINDLRKLRKEGSPAIELDRKKKRTKSSIFSMFIVLLFIAAGSYYFIEYYGKNNMKSMDSQSKINKVLTVENRKSIDNQDKENINTKIKKNPIIKPEQKTDNKKEKIKDNKKSEKSLGETITEPITNKSFDVIITSNAKADVIIDNKLIGTIPPKKMIKLKKGKHKVIFMKGEGNNIKTIVKDIMVGDTGKPVIINQTFDLYARVKMINAFPWANVYLDKINKSGYLGLTPIKKDIKIREGKHVLIFLNNSYEPYHYNLTVEGGKTIDKIHIKLQEVAVKKIKKTGDGYIKMINASPWGKIFIDGKYFGDTPVRNVKLKAGEHIIKIEHPNYKPFVKKIIIEKDKEFSPIIVNLRLND